MIKITKTEHLFLQQVDNLSDIYIIKAVDDNEYVVITSIYRDETSDQITMKSVGNNFQTYICTFDLFSEYIKLVDEAYYLLECKHN